MHFYRRCLCPVFAGLLFASSSAWAQDNAPKDDLKQVQQEIKAGEQRQKDLQQQSQALGDREEGLQQRLIDAAAKAQAQENAVIDIENRLLRLEEERETRLNRLAAQRKELETSLNGLQKLARRPPASLIAQPDKNLIDTLRAADLLAALVPVYEEKAETLRRELEALSGLERNIRQELTNLETSRQALEGERKALVGLLARTERDRKRLRGATQQEQKRMAALAARSQNLQGLIAKLQADIPKPRKKPRKQGNTASKPRDNRPSIEGQAPDIRDFARHKGELTRPVAGPVRQSYGRKNAKNLTSRGIEIETRAKSAVLAPWDGKIAFAGPYRGYGQVLIIQHSDGYHSLLSGLSRLYGVSGQYVLAGEPMGEMAASPDRQRLYLELRKGSNPIDPTPWLTRAKRKGSS